MKQFTLSIEFGASESKYFDNAVELVQSLGGGSPRKDGVYQLTHVLEPGANLAKIKKLFRLVRDWKSTELKLNNRTVQADRVSEIIAAVQRLRKPNVPSDWKTTVDWKAWGKPLGLNREKYRDQQALKRALSHNHIQGEFHPIDFTLSYERLPSASKNELVVRAEDFVVGTIPTRYISEAVSSIKILDLPPFRVPGVIRSNNAGQFNFFIWRKKLLDPGVSLWGESSEREEAVISASTREPQTGDIFITLTIRPFGELRFAQGNVSPGWIENRAWMHWEAPVNIVAGAQYYVEDLQKLLGPPRLGGHFIPTPVQFLREPTNEYDPNAIVIRVNDTRLGYVPRERARHIAPILDRERMSEFHLAGVLRGDHPQVGCEVWISRRLTRAPDLANAIHIEEQEKTLWPPPAGEAGHFVPLRKLEPQKDAAGEKEAARKGCLSRVLGWFRISRV